MVGSMGIEKDLSYCRNCFAMGVVKMNYLRRSFEVSRVEEEIRDKMSTYETIVGRVERRGLKWFGHHLRILDSKKPKWLLGWTPSEKRKDHESPGMREYRK